MLKRLTLSAALAVCFAGTAHSAVRLTESFDGGWFDPAASGRGWMFDVIPGVTGPNTVNPGAPSNTFFAMTFTYIDGVATWLVVQGDFLEFEFSKANIPLLAFTGGSFGDPFTGATSSTIGTASVTVENANSVSITLNPSAASGLAAVTLPLQRLGGPVDFSDNPYQRSFTSCPSFAQAVPNLPRTCVLTGDYLGQDITLTAETTWAVEGRALFGGDNTGVSTLRVEPGTLIIGTGDTFDHIYVNRGSKTFMHGTRDFPIIFTAPTDGVIAETAPKPKDVGGFVVAGNAPVNCAGGQCAPEFAPEFRYGGSNAADSSGVIEYVQSRYAGYVYQTDREINSFTFLGVGNGTKVEYIQAYRGGDDGVEYFGGTVNSRYVVVNEGGDDGIDWDEGYSGKLQFGLVLHGAGNGEDHGFEVSNNPNNFDAQPRAIPTVANFTVIGNNRGRDGLNLKEGTGGRFHNMVLTDFGRSCISIEGLATYTSTGTPANLSGNLTIRNSRVHCPGSVNFRDSAGTGNTAPFTTQAWFTAQPGNSAGDPGFVETFLPAANSPLIGGGAAVGGDNFFTSVSYIGAFRDRNDRWYRGWTVGLN